MKPSETKNGAHHRRFNFSSPQVSPVTPEKPVLDLGSERGRAVVRSIVGRCLARYPDLISLPKEPQLTYSGVRHRLEHGIDINLPKNAPRHGSNANTTITNLAAGHNRLAEVLL